MSDYRLIGGKLDGTTRSVPDDHDQYEFIHSDMDIINYAEDMKLEYKDPAFDRVTYFRRGLSHGSRIFYVSEDLKFVTPDTIIDLLLSNYNPKRDT